MFNNLWVEKYRPKTLDEMVLSTENRNYFLNLKGEVPNLLFVGTPGIGKTTIARIIVHDILKCQYLYINASDENGIDTIRSKVGNFSQTKSIDGNIKIVILDEADGITLDGQRALRNTMEEYSGYTRFILTANYKHKIIPAIQSRTQYFDLNPPIADVLKRIVFILNSESIKLPDDQKKKLAQLIKDNYPDIRKTINAVQKCSVSGELNINQSIDTIEIAKTIHSSLQQGKVFELRKYLIENEHEFQGDYGSLLKTYLNFVYSKAVFKTDEHRKQAIVVIGEHLYKDVFVFDKEINAFVCFCQLEKLIS